MNRTLAQALRITLIVSVVVVAISAALALAFLGVAQWLPNEISSGRIQWDDHTVVLSNAFSGGMINIMVAFALMTLAMLITVAAVVFSVVVTAISLAAAVAALLLAACVVGFPFLLIGGIVWLVVRRNKRHMTTVNLTAQA